MVHDKTVLMGFYQGLGDFVSAVPVMNRLLAQGNRLYLAASKQNVMLAEAIRFRGGAVEFLEFSLFSPNRPGALMRFVRQLVRLQPDLVYVSPHAQRQLSSWKIPALLAIINRLFWKTATVIGARDEKLSQLFDVILPVDKSLDLLHREWALHYLAGSFDIESPPEYSEGIDWNLNRSVQGKGVDLVIHPGASKHIRMWPVENYTELVKLLGDSIKITVVGLESELEPLRVGLGQFRNVKFFSGSLTDVVAITSAGKAVITMDSGFSHIAAFLGVHHLAIFGASSPDMHGPFAENSGLMFNRSMPCQPCDRYDCKIGTIACMRLVTPSMVAVKLTEMLSGESVESTP